MVLLSSEHPFLNRFNYIQIMFERSCVLIKYHKDLLGSYNCKSMLDSE
uniref:Uncharacterized protein n=1 Tax=Lepeophtheirus salmonis TaxID=72036 RepID=A0A0K2TWA6_LEPSM